jgi:hypothetical protein
MKIFIQTLEEYAELLDRDYSTINGIITTFNKQSDVDAVRDIVDIDKRQLDFSIRHMIEILKSLMKEKASVKR